MKKFFLNLKKYGYYSAYSAISMLRAEVSGSYFNWLWWFLDPILFMMVYSFVAIIVFGKSEPYFPVFVFLGLGAWNFFNRTVTVSVKIVRSYKSVISRTYMPKYILVLTTIYKNLFQYLITLLISFTVAIFMGVPLTLNILYMMPIIITLVMVTFGVSCIVLHCGVYIKDLGNLVQVGLKLLFYMTGIFYSIPKRVSAPASIWMLRINPIAMLVNEARNVFIYGEGMHLSNVAIWLMLAVVLSALGVLLINKYEQTYVKAI